MVDIPQQLYNLKWLAIADGVFGILCIIFQILDIVFSPIQAASIGTGLYAGIIFGGTAFFVFKINLNGGSGWFFGIALSLAAMSALTGLQLLALNLSHFIPVRGTVILLGPGLTVMSVLLVLVGLVAAPVNVLTCFTLIKAFIGSMDCQKPSNTLPS